MSIPVYRKKLADDKARIESQGGGLFVLAQRAKRKRMKPKKMKPKKRAKPRRRAKSKPKRRTPPRTMRGRFYSKKAFEKRSLTTLEKLKASGKGLLARLHLRGRSK